MVCPTKCLTYCLRYITDCRLRNLMTRRAATWGHGPWELSCVLKKHAVLGRFPQLKEQFFRRCLSVSYYHLQPCDQENKAWWEGVYIKNCILCVHWSHRPGWKPCHGNLIVIRKHSLIPINHKGVKTDNTVNSQITSRFFHKLTCKSVVLNADSFYFHTNEGMEAHKKVSFLPKNTSRNWLCFSLFLPFFFLWIYIWAKLF